MSEPFLSIVTISYNQAKYLRQCIDSVLSQKEDDIEYIVVDGGSEDGSVEILRSYGSAIDHLIVGPDAGPADALNKGFAVSTGRIGYFINSDDYMLPRAIQHIRRLWATNPDIQAICAAAWIVDSEGKPLLEVQPMRANLESLVRGYSSIVQHGFSFRMDLFRSVEGFNKSNQTCWDYELVCAMLNKGCEVSTFKERIGVFRLHESSFSGGGHGLKHEREYLVDLARIQDEYAGSRQSRLIFKPKLARYFMNLTQPMWVFNKLANHMLASRRAKRWLNDSLK